jgi:hypothetical protein
LLAFAAAIYDEAQPGLELVRARTLEWLGPHATVDAAAVAANFQRMVRIADGTGITLGGMEKFSAPARAELDLERFVRQRIALE